MSIFNKKSIRLKTETQGQNDSYVTIQMNQTYDFIDVLSLKLPTKNIYRQFNSEFGVVAGRVNAMGGVGIPNARVGIFIPKDNEIINAKIAKCKTDIDKDRIRISELLYPYETIDDTDSNGKRYNLLPSKGRNRLFNGWPFNTIGIGSTPKTPLGSFPEKEEVLSDENWLYVFDNYYYLVTTTNKAGDYMLYVPIGAHNLVLDVDITDIGQFSVTPAIMSKTMGYSPSLFEQDGTKIKKTNDLNSAPNIINQNLTVNVKPLWNQDAENPEVGVTRQDFDINVELKPSFTIFSSLFGMDKDTYYGDRTIFRIFLGLKCLCFKPKINLNCKGDINFKSNKCQWDFGIDGNFCTTRLAFNIPLPDPIGDIYIDTGIEIPTGFWFGFRFKTIAFVPWMFLRLFSVRYCSLNGGKFTLPPMGIIWLNDIGCFRTDDIVDLGGDKTTLDEALDRNFGTLNLSEDISNMKNVKTELSVFQVKSDIILSNGIDLERDIIKLSDSEFVSFEDKELTLQIVCNRRRQITAEDGTLIDSNNEKGVFTEWDGFITLKPIDNISSDGDKVKIITPNFRIPSTNNSFTEIFNFKFNEIYSINTLMGVNNTNNECVGGLFANGLFGEKVPLITGLFADCDLGGNDNNIMYNTPGKILIVEPEPEKYPLVNNYFNITVNEGNESIGNFSFDYLKYSLYFPNVLARKPYISGRRTKMRSCTRILEWDRLLPNNEIIGGVIKNRQYFINADYFKTSFFKVEKSDFIEHYNKTKAFKEENLYYYKGFLGEDSLDNVVNKNLV